jgi:hypothetical protein
MNFNLGIVLGQKLDKEYALNSECYTKEVCIEGKSVSLVLLYELCWKFDHVICVHGEKLGK